MAAVDWPNNEVEPEPKTAVVVAVFAWPKTGGDGLAAPNREEVVVVPKAVAPNKDGAVVAGFWPKSDDEPKREGVDVVAAAAVVAVTAAEPKVSGVDSVETVASAGDSETESGAGRVA